MVPNLYLLLTQTLVKMHAHPITLLLVLRQARCSADQLNATLSGFAYSSAAIHGSASHLLDSEFAQFTVTDPQTTKAANTEKFLP